MADFFPQITEQTAWSATPTLAAIIERAQDSAGVPSADDPYAASWVRWANRAVETVLEALAPFKGGRFPTQAAVTADDNGLVNLAAWPVLRIDRAGTLDADGAVAWLPWGRTDRPFTGEAESSTGADGASALTASGDATRVYRLSPYVLGLAPIPGNPPTVVVQGLFLPVPMSETTDAAGVDRKALEAVSLRCALYAAKSDPGNDWLMARIPDLQADYDRALRSLKLACLRATPAPTEGFDGLGSPVAAPSSTTAATTSEPVPLTTGVYATQSAWEYAAGGETEVTIDVTAAPVASGHEDGVVVKSAWRGELTGTVTVTGGTSIAAATGIDPDTAAPIELMAGEPYRAAYMKAVAE